MSTRGFPRLTLGFALLVAIVSLGSCCTEDQWKCKSGECVDLDDLCDGRLDCTDGSDETLNSCSDLSCPSFAFRCAYGACVALSARCNGVKDCADNSDEMMCNSEV